MIIGIDASRANKTHKTGTEWYAYYLIRNFALLDKENEYILYTNKPLRGGLANLYETKTSKEEKSIVYDKDGYQILQSPHGNFKAKILNWPWQFFWTLGGLSLEMLRYRPDVLFIPSHVLPFFRPKKSIITIHDIGFIKDESLFGKEKIGPDVLKAKSFINIIVRIFTLNKYGANSFDYLRWSTKFALKKATKVISVSNFTKQELLKYYKTDKNKIKVIYNGYNSQLYKKITNQNNIDKVLRKYGVEQPYLFYIGRLEKKKNIATLIEAFAILRDKNQNINHKLVLVGDASYGYDEIKYMTREFDLVDEVIMPGWLNEEIIPYFYSGATAFIFPSKYEGFGIPLLQSMACQTPIACSATSAIPEVAGEAAAYFNPNYALSIAESIEKIINNQDYANILINKGNRRIKNFGWHKTAKETLALIVGSK